jgi:transposase
MPAPYSEDLRKKVLDAVDRGESKLHISKLFKISRNTIDLWLKQRATTGSIQPKRDTRRGPGPKIADLDEFRSFAQSHGHMTQREMAEAWQGEVSNHTIGKALQRIGFTRKKNIWVP